VVVNRRAGEGKVGGEKASGQAQVHNCSGQLFILARQSESKEGAEWKQQQLVGVLPFLPVFVPQIASLPKKYPSQAP
jgi:hypothetical protein